MDALLVVRLLAATLLIVGGVTSADPLMSWLICVPLSAALKSRTSSSRPEKYSPQTEFPPIRSAPVDVRTEPVMFVLATCVPLTYSFNTVPLNVAATCDHVFKGSE